MVSPERLTIEAIEAALSLPTQRWHGRCYEIAWAITEDFDLVEGMPVYGSWTGQVNRRGYWKNRAHLSFVRHGWVRLPDGRILDPTRWSFENKEPYIWLGGPSTKGFEDYDECNDRLRQAQYANRPCPPEYAHKKFYELPLEHGARLFLFKRSEEVLPRPLKEEPLCLNFVQLMWVANLPVADLGPYAREVYQAIIAVGQRATIPFDNRTMILGQEAQI